MAYARRGVLLALSHLIRVAQKFYLSRKKFFRLPCLWLFPCDKRSAEHGARCTLRSTCAILPRRTPIARLDFLAAPASRFKTRVREMNGRGCVRENILGNKKTEFAAHETARSVSRQMVLGGSEMGAGLLRESCPAEKFKRTQASTKLCGGDQNAVLRQEEKFWVIGGKLFNA